MKTIARNFKKNPHTANFLMTFHAASAGLPSDLDENQAEIDLAAEDLLDQVADLDVVDYRTPGQVKFMEDLIARLARLDASTGAAARKFTDDVTTHGLWVQKSGTKYDPSLWIDRMITKEKALKTAAPVAPTTTPEIPAGHYAIVDGEVKCYSVEYGKDGTKWAGFTFLNRISSDDRFPIRNGAEKARILAAIAADVDGAAVLAAHTLRQCRRCHRTLSDTKNPYFAQGLGPDCGQK